MKLLSHRTAATGVALVVSALALAGCAGSADEADNSNVSGAPAGDCGVVDPVAPADPDGLVAAMSPTSQELYGGHPYPVYASEWADWAPEGEGPFTVGIAFGPLLNAHQTDILAAIEEGLKESPLVEKVITTTTTGNDASAQLQQYNSLVQQGADLIVYQPIASDAFVSAVEQAAAQGIPSVAAQTSVDSPFSVNVNPNNYRAAAEATAGLLENIGGEGKILAVHGVPSFAADKASFDAFNAAVKKCPDVEVVGEVTGLFESAAAKTEVLTFLSTYSGDVAGVFQPALMAPGIISAFEESGLEVPTVTDLAAQKASLSYWDDNSDTYAGIGVGQSSSGTGAAIAEVVTRMLAGDGVKVSEIILDLPVITDENLGEWAENDWDKSSIGNAPGPDGAALLTPEYLSDVFTTTSN